MRSRAYGLRARQLYRLHYGCGARGPVAPDERIRRGVVPELRLTVGDLVCELGCEQLAELDAPLVERVDAPDRTLREHAVLVQPDKGARAPRG